MATEAQDKITEVAQEWPETASALTVSDTGSYEAGALLLKGIKALKAEADEVFDETIKAAHTAHKAAVAMKKKVVEPLDKAKRIISGKMGEYQEQLERVRREEQRRLEAEARAREEEQRLAEAAAAEAAGDAALADEILDMEPETLPVPIAQDHAPKVEGVAVRTLYSAEVVDKGALVKYISANESLHYLIKTFDTAALNQMARSQRQAFKLPGCRLVKKKSIAS